MGFFIKLVFKFYKKRDLSLMVEYETFNLCCMGSNPIGLKLYTFIK